MSIYDNSGRSFIISGSSYLNTLYYYNKRISYYQSINDQAHKKDIEKKKHIYTTNRINFLYEKKNRIINYIIHKTTKTIVDYCVYNNITKVIIGDVSGIDNIKTDKIGKQRKEFNQKFT